MQQETYALPQGLTFSDIARPESIQEIADILRMAGERNVPVVPIGGGTALSVGNPVSGEFLGIDLRNISGVRSYEPADLTASFHAGTTLADVHAVLAEQGQELPLDMPRMEQATIGGLVATGFSGPRRLGSGTLKDLLIGCAYV
ncbi:MAG TPA: FAD-dependent oxidoreductase, partial [Thermomicrobiales bacterium]|nr:FAD-dependent oxidoreductase [Thermomicrobiales bacterium]